MSLIQLPDHKLVNAWEQLAALEINGNDPVCDNDGEQWQYLGSVVEKDQTITHQFRHRFHPKTKEREYQNISEAIKP